MVNIKMTEDSAVALAQQAKAQGITQKQLVCRALQKAGVPIDPQDLEDPHPTSEGSMRAAELPGYDTDTARWAEEQAALLRRRANLANNDELDWLHLAEEIDILWWWPSEKREVRSPAGTHCPAPVEVALSQPELRSRSWETTLVRNAMIC